MTKPVPPPATTPNTPIRIRLLTRAVIPAECRQRPCRSGARHAATRTGARVRFMAPRSLVLKVTVGRNDPERCNQAFTVAATAAASGVPLSVWLTGEAAWFALPGRGGDVVLPHAMPLGDLLSGVLAAGTVTVCS